jgi:hypothetical protein
MRLYYFAILGAIGGLIGWKLSDLLGLSFTPYLILNEVIVGGVIGLVIGLLIGMAEGIARQNAWQALQSAGLGCLLGLAGGAIGLPIAELFYIHIFGGQVWSRAIGWAIFGLAIGAASGFKSGAQIWKSALGGLLGGALGGILLEWIRSRIHNQTLGKALGMLTLGLMIGVFIALIVWALSRVWLTVKNGKLKGTEFMLDKFLRKGFPSIIIGSSALKAEIVLPDPDIAPQHAMLTGDGTNFKLRDISTLGTFVNGSRIEEATLRNRQVIKLGNTELEYREKR